MRKLEKLHGLSVLVGDLDDVLEIVRTSGYRYEARSRLMDRYGLNMNQVSAFLDMSIGKLTAMDQEALRVEYLTVKEGEEEKPKSSQKRDDIGKGDLFSVKEMAKHLPVAEITIRKWILERRLPVTRLGRRIFVRRETLEKLKREGLEALT